MYVQTVSYSLKPFIYIRRLTNSHNKYTHKTLQILPRLSVIESCNKRCPIYYTPETLSL